MDYTEISNQTSLRERLLNENLRITFTKKDGTERAMYCTLNPNAVPTKETKTNSRTLPATSLAVFDLEKSEWRSFRWDSITSVN